MADMSPKAVTQRLRLMDELWELSVKLMNATKLSDQKNHEGVSEGELETSTRVDGVLKCESCSEEFQYALVNNGFNDSAYTYCDTCGRTAFLSGWFAGIPKNAPLKLHEKISQDLEPFLEACECGGRFTSGAVPRCPRCRNELSATDVAGTIERNAPGTQKGWRWQRTWDGLYCIVIEDRVVDDIWKKDL